MGKIKYLFKRIIKMDYKNMFKIAKAISKKIKKNTLFILLDMIKCGLKYQAGYYDYQEFEFYNLNKKERNTYLTRGKNNEIIKSLLPCKNINYSTDPLVKQYYVLYLDFNITNNYNSSYSQSLFCCFTYDINSHILNACTNMLNREILIKD